jgi:hypothetical protein
MLVFSAIGKGLRKVDLKDENIVEIVAFAADSWSRVTSFNDTLYYTHAPRFLHTQSYAYVCISHDKAVVNAY